MAFAIRFPALRRRPPRYQRRPRVIANRRARESLSRTHRWKRRGSSGGVGKLLWMIAGGAGLVAAGWFLHTRDIVPKAAPLAFPAFVAEAEAAFPESVNGHTRAIGGRLSDGRDVPVGLTMLLPAHALESASAAPDALVRLAAPFVGAERAIAGDEMGERIAKLAASALPDGVSRCYSYALGATRRVAVSEDRTVNVAPLEIAFNPEC